jgi:ribosome-associated translation inhibitor RaiA
MKNFSFAHQVRTNKATTKPFSQFTISLIGKTVYLSVPPALKELVEEQLTSFERYSDFVSSNELCEVRTPITREGKELNIIVLKSTIL